MPVQNLRLHGAESFSASWEVKSHSVNQKKSRGFLQNPTAYYYFQNIPPLDATLRQMKPVYTFSPYYI
jgi:hypothetical protein